MSLGFKSPILVTGTFTPVGTQDVNIISPLPLGVAQTALASSIVRVPSSLSNVTLIVANSARKGLLIYNDSTAFQYVKLGILASTIDFTVRLTPHMLYEVAAPVHTGQVDVISSSTNGAIQVTELT